MKHYSVIITLLLALTLQPAQAQKRKAVKKKPTPVIEEEPSKFDEMLRNTQKIVFVDSIVVEKPQFLTFYKLTSEAGTVTGYNQFFRSEDQPYSTVYVNQLGNKCWYANNGSLYTSDLLGSQWSEPSAVEGLGQFLCTNYPFMLSDGKTLYFSAIGGDGLGGLDIYVSRYDSEEGKFLLAENLGLPFNSEANDYMYAVDELTGIGYFATDRHQPDGWVCIYTFIPNSVRQSYSIDEYEEEVIRSRARIDCIADTWGDGVIREEALLRLNALDKLKVKKKQSDFTFIINDDITYNSLTDFRDDTNRERINTLGKLRKRYKSLATEIEKARTYYATKAAPNEKSGLKAEILDYELEYYQLENNIRQIEKTIRNSESLLLKP